MNFAQQFRLGAQDYLTPDQNSSQNSFDVYSPTFIHKFLPRLIFGAFTTIKRLISSSFKLYSQISGALTWQDSGVLRSILPQFESLPLDQLYQTISENFGKLKLWEKIFGFHVTQLGFADPSCSSIRFFAIIWGPAQYPRENLLCCRMLEIQFYFQCGGGTPHAPRRVAHCGDSNVPRHF